ncbi:MAG: CheY-like chemotaxis protein [Oceanicoccus sp.]
MIVRLSLLLWVLWPPLGAIALEVQDIQLKSANEFSVALVWLSVAFGLVLLGMIAVALYGRKVYQRLTKDNANWQLIWSSLPDALTEVDGDGVILTVNHSLFPDPRFEFTVGSSHYAYLSEEGKALFRLHLDQALSTGHMSQYELAVQLHGQTRYTQNRIMPLAMGLQKKALVMISDITRYKDAQRVLQQDKQQSERELKGKAKILMNVSQEMRGPMTVLRDVLSQIQGQKSDTRVNQVHTMQASIDHLSQIIEDVSLLSLKSNTDQSLESVNTSLWHVIDDLEALYLPQASQFQVTLRFTHECLPHFVQTDAFRLRQVLYNLMSCHLSLCHGGELEMEIHQTELANEPVIQFSITNDLSPQIVDSWVDLFNQRLKDSQVACLDNASVASFRICQSLAGHLSGILGAKSLGNGKIKQWFTLPFRASMDSDSFSLFKHKPIVLAIEDESDMAWFQVFFKSMQLPFQVKNNGEIPPNTSLLVSDHSQSLDCQWLWWIGEDYELTAGHGTLLSSPYRRETLYYRLSDYQASQTNLMSENQPSRILLVEDNLNNQLVIKRTLEKLGYDVIVASNGEEGVAQFKAQEVDCIIMDIYMPILDGIEATRQIRQLDKPYVPVIALTANSQKEVEEACFAVGMDSFLTKPISRQEIQATLEEFLGKQKPQENSRWVNEQ